MEVKQITLDELKPIKSEGLDLSQYHNKQVRIEKAEVLQVPSSFTPFKKGSATEHILQWVLKVQSEVVASIGEGDERIDFRASEIFNLVQDDEGNLKGYPENEQSNIMKFMKDIRANSPHEIVGKTATIKAYDKEQVIEGKKVKRTYLKFKY